MAAADPTRTPSGPVRTFDLRGVYASPPVVRWQRRWRWLREGPFLAGVAWTVFFVAPVAYYAALDPARFLPSAFEYPLLAFTVVPALLIALAPSLWFGPVLPAVELRVEPGRLRIVRDDGQERTVDLADPSRASFWLFCARSRRHPADPPTFGLVTRSDGWIVFLPPPALETLRGELAPRGYAPPRLLGKIPAPVTSVTGWAQAWGVGRPKRPSAAGRPAGPARFDRGRRRPRHLSLLGGAVALGLLLLVPEIGGHAFVEPPFPANYSFQTFSPNEGPSTMSGGKIGGLGVLMTLNYSASRVWGQMYLTYDYDGGTDPRTFRAAEAFDFSLANPRTSYPWVLDRTEVSSDGSMEIIWPAYPPCFPVSAEGPAPCAWQYQLLVGVR